MRKITNEELGRPSAEEFAAMEKMPVTVVLDNVRSAQNAGALFRTGDAFAVERIVLCGITATPPSRDIHKTALGAEMTVPWSYCASTVGCIAQLRAEGYAVYAVEQVEGAVMLDAFRAAPGVKYALVFGNEASGLPDAFAQMGVSTLIPHSNQIDSLNLAIAAGIGMYAFTRR